MAGRSKPKKGRKSAQIKSRHIESFLEMLSAERSTSLRTLDAYQRDLDDFERFLGPLKVAAEVAETAVIRRYLAGLGRAGLAATTIGRRLSALRQFHKFLVAEGVRNDDPTSILESPKRPRTLPKILSEAEVDLLLGTVPTVSGFGRWSKSSMRRACASPNWCRYPSPRSITPSRSFLSAVKAGANGWCRLANQRKQPSPTTLWFVTTLPAVTK